MGHWTEHIRWEGGSIAASLALVMSLSLSLPSVCRDPAAISPVRTDGFSMDRTVNPATVSVLLVLVTIPNACVLFQLCSGLSVALTITFVSPLYVSE